MKPISIVIGIIVMVGFGVFFSSKNTITPNQKSEIFANFADEIAPHYVNYSKESLARSQAHGRVVLYFYAPWCSTCSILDDELKKQGSQLPPDVTILKVNYDTERELKKKYNVVMQHTLVQIDKDGNKVTRWIGGGIETIKEHVM